jgi:hypothetical protein
MPLGTEGDLHERRFGLRARFAQGLPAAISFEDVSGQKPLCKAR